MMVGAMNPIGATWGGGWYKERFPCKTFRQIYLVEMKPASCHRGTIFCFAGLASPTTITPVASPFNSRLKSTTPVSKPLEGGQFAMCKIDMLSYGSLV